MYSPIDPETALRNVAAENARQAETSRRLAALRGQGHRTGPRRIRFRHQ